MKTREISTKLIEDTVCELFLNANIILPPDINRLLKSTAEVERNSLARSVLNKTLANAAIAKDTGIPICQDTGMAFVFITIGQDVHINGGGLRDAVNAGVRRAYAEGYLRKSVADPLTRVNTGDNTPAVVYFDIVEGDTFEITAMPKGFGSENMSRIKMMNPTSTEDDIISFVSEVLLSAGGNPCPPTVVGVGIGGSFDYAAFLAKKALLRPAGDNNSPNAALEKKLLDAVNKTGVGPQGFGGDTSCLWVNVEKYPTHIASLPVAVNVSCHATRHTKAAL